MNEPAFGRIQEGELSRRREFLEVRNALLPTLPDASAEGVDKRPHVQAENCSYRYLTCMWHITSYYQQ